MILIIIFLIIAGVVIGIVYPFFQTKTEPITTEKKPFENDIDELEDKRDLAYAALKELEFDYETGKLSETDYEEIKQKYTLRAVDAMKALEKYNTENTTKIPSAPSQEKMAASKSSLNFCPSCGDKIKEGAKFCSSCGHSLGNVCSSCGKEYTKEEKFCSSCGQKLN